MAEPSRLSAGGLGRRSNGGDSGSLTGEVVPTEGTHLLTHVESGGSSIGTRPSSKTQRVVVMLWRSGRPFDFSCGSAQVLGSHKKWRADFSRVF